MKISVFNKDFENKRIVIRIIFDFPLNVIWDAFTNPKTLEKWFAPKPFTVVTKYADFREGGGWLYYMLSPEGEKFWSMTKYLNIVPNKTYLASDAFCDENGAINTDFPQAKWLSEFTEESGVTAVDINISFASENDARQIIEMGFEEGYKMALEQLQEILDS